MTLGTARGCMHLERQPPDFSETAAPSSKRDILHQRDLLETTHPIEDLSTQRESLVSVRQPEAEGSEIEDPQPSAIERRSPAATGGLCVQPETGQRRRRVVERRLQGRQPSVRQPAIGVQKEQPSGSRRPRPEIELRPTTARTLHHPCTGRGGQLARSVDTAAISHHDFDAVGLPHRLETGSNRALLIEGRDDYRQIQIASRMSLGDTPHCI